MHHNPKACETFCCYNCSGTLTVHPCGLYYTLSGTIFARIINQDDVVMPTAVLNFLLMPETGTYRLQVTCGPDTDWLTVDEVDFVLNVASCTCCDIMEPYTTHTLTGLEVLNSACYTFPSSITFPTKLFIDWQGNSVYSRCHSGYVFSEDRSNLFPFAIMPADVNAQSCGTSGGLTYAIRRIDIAIGANYSTSPGLGTPGISGAQAQVDIEFFFTDGVSVSSGLARYPWRTDLCPSSSALLSIWEPTYFDTLPLITIDPATNFLTLTAQ